MDFIAIHVHTYMYNMMVDYFIDTIGNKNVFWSFLGNKIPFHRWIMGILGSFGRKNPKYRTSQ